MNEQEGRDIVERLRRAQRAGAPVDELHGDEARAFVFVDHVAARPVLLGTFAVTAPNSQRFFVTVVVKANKTNEFQFFVMDRKKGSPILGTSNYSPTSLIWRYSPTKQSGDNAARKRAFIEANGSATIEIPLPSDDVRPFAEAIQRAIMQRRVADGEAVEDGDLGTHGDAEPPDSSEDIVAELTVWHPDPNILSMAAQTMVAAIREAHAAAPARWSVTRREDQELLRLNVGTGRMFDLAKEHLRIAIDTELLSPDDVATLGSRLDSTDVLNAGKFGPNAVVQAPPTEMATLLPRLLPSYRSLLTKAAKTAPLHQRHHSPSALEALRELTGGDVPQPQITVTPTTAYWKVSPGEKGSDWQRCKDAGFIGVGWEDVGDLRLLSREQFDARVQQLGHSPGVEALWKFKNINVGDRMVANGGTTRILGIGTVTGPYYFAEGEAYAHRLPVEWSDVVERSVNMKGWRQTLIRLTEATFSEIEAAPRVGDVGETIDEASPVGGIDFDGILSHLETKSLFFPEETVAAYLLALQVRRFVLLTGISGTGKTQLALEVARLFAPDVPGVGAPTSDAVEVSVKPYHLKFGRFVVPARLSKQLDALYDDTQKRIDVRIMNGPIESMAISKSPDNQTLLQVLLSGESKLAFQRTFSVGDRMLIRQEARGDREMLVVESPRPVAALHEPTHALIAVRPDWTDARSLVGFYNPLTKGYVTTPTLDLLRKAQTEVERASSAGAAPRPYFLIFDEMNLARVEHYFSDFLSAMESGEEIHLHDDDDLAEADENPTPKRVRIPKNVFVVGTVNIDETTYMFSPKVLDRAFVIEFNHVDLDTLGGRREVEQASSTPLALTNMGTGLKLLGRPDDAEWTGFETALDGALARELKDLHDALTSDNRHFGYRVARDVARFVDLAREQTAGTPEALRAAFDLAVLSKILPKLHGGQAEIEGPLTRLFAIACGINATNDRAANLDDQFLTDGVQLIGAEGGAALPMPRTALKLWRMRRRLRAQGFVSFIE